MPTLPRFFVLTGAIALAVAGCGASTAPPHAADRRVVIATPSPRSGGSLATPLTAAAPPSPPPVHAPPPPVVRGTAPPARDPVGSTAAAPRHPAPATSQSRSNASTAAGLTAPGTYTYSTSGTTRTVLGSKPATDPSTLTVRTPAGNHQQSTLNGPDGTTDQLLENRADGLYLVDVAISAAGFTADFRPPQPVLFLPSATPVGDSWSWRITSTDGTYTVASSFRVTGQSSAAVGGTSVPCVVVAATVEITGGGFAITMTRTECASTKYVLPLREHSVSDGTAFATPYHADITRALTSITPN